MMIKAVAAAALAAVLAFLLSEYGYRGKRLFSTLAVVMLFGVGAVLFGSAYSLINGLGTPLGLGEGAACAVKIIGMGYIFGISSDICRELGEGGIATALTTVGRLEIFLTVLPYILKAVELGAELIK